jgi:hypothetical protein
LLVHLSALVFLVILIAATPGQNTYAIERYHPEIADKKIVPQWPNPYSNTEIVITVLDRFGEIQNAFIVYSTDNWRTNSTQQMKLANGDLSNGTFVGVIGQQTPGTVVQFKVSLEDNLGYSIDYIDHYATEEDRLAPALTMPSFFPYQPGPKDDILVRTMATDEESGIRSAVLTFSTTDQDYHGPTSIEMLPELVTKDDERYIKYHIWIPAQPLGATVKFFIETSDYSGKSTKSEEQSFVVTEPIDRKIRFSIYEITEVNVPYTATAKLSLIGTLPTNSSFNSVPVLTSGYNKGTLTVPFYNDRVSQVGQNTVTENLNLFGRPWNYPFDKYHAILSFRIDLPNVEIDYPKTTIYANEAVNRFWNVRVVEQDSKVVHDTEFSQLDLKLEFTRNDDILPLQLALVSAFFLLGSTLMIANKDISNRLLITIGVFALIFSFYQIMESTKPYAFGNATYADVVIAFLLFITVVYTMVSIFVALVHDNKKFFGTEKKEAGFYLPIIGSMIIVFGFAISKYAYDDVGWAAVAAQIGLVAGFIVRIIVLSRIKPVKRESKDASKS